MGRIIKITLTLLLTITATVHDIQGGPVRNHTAIYTQPDGSSFQAYIRGDEWTRIRTTSEGHAIVRNEEGWWCYGIYDDDGTIKDTGYKVGSEVPSEILSSSLVIPYRKLSESAQKHLGKVSIQNKEALMATRQAVEMQTKSSVKHKHGLAILVEFQDTKFTYTKDDFHKLLNQEDYNGTGSAKDYYEDQFGENWKFSFDVSDIVTLPNKTKYYGENGSNGLDGRPEVMVKEACEAIDDVIDFSIYDQDGDGEVDNVYVFFAGHDEAEKSENTDLLWGHQYYIYSGTAGITLFCDGVRINRYACSSELTGAKKMTGIGTFCHEFMHTLGVPDFYDTNYDEDGSWAAGLWRSTAIMDAGNYNNNGATPPNLNCIERRILRLSSPFDIEAGNSYSITPIEKGGFYCRLKTDTDGEYYLLEYRTNEGWDKYIGGKGMLVYHIDENSDAGPMNRWYYKNAVNNDADHQCADLIEADNRSDKITSFSAFSDIKGVFFPYGDVTSLTPENISSYKFWNGNTPPISIVGISEADGYINFKAVNSNAITEVPDVEGFNFTSYPDGVYINFTSTIPSAEAKAILEWRKNGSEKYNVIHLDTGQDGSYHCLIEGLESGNTLYEIQIKFEIEGVLGKTHKTQFMTKRSPAISWPYLYMDKSGEIDRNKGFIAHVVNASKAVGKNWYLNGKELEIKNGCLIFPQSDGELCCRITWKDGTTDTIIKNIKLTE